MVMRQVEVDDEVFAFVKERAEPLVDTFNSAIRRLLPIGQKDKRGPDSGLTFPSGTPEALRQILEVVCLVRGGAYTRVAAKQFVAKRHGVREQTVGDKYARQLDLTASQFDRLLEQGDLSDLRALLKGNFPEHVALIEDSMKPS